MTFGTAVQICFRKYADFTGFATRSEFWWWILFHVLVTAALNVFNTVPFGENSTLGTTLATLWAIAVLLPTLAVSVRRLRDAGHGWVALLWTLVPVVGTVIVLVLCAQPGKVTASAAGPRR